MVNQYCIYPIGRLQNVELYLAGVNTMAYFEVIEIMGGKDPYPALLGTEWDYEDFPIIDFKKEIMTFEEDGIKVTQPIDPYQFPRYMDPIEDNMEEDALDHLYTLTTRKKEDYINPTVDGLVSW
jgi:hypothetical protein